MSHKVPALLQPETGGRAPPRPQAGALPLIAGKRVGAPTFDPSHGATGTGNSGRPRVLGQVKLGVCRSK